MLTDLPFNFDALKAAYARGLTPQDVVGEVFRRVVAADDPGIFIHLAAPEDLLIARPSPARPESGGGSPADR